MRKRMIFASFNNRQKMFIKMTISTVVIIAVGFYFFKVVRRYLKADYFKVRDVLVKEGMSPDLYSLKGANIFEIDLREINSQIKNSYPQFKEIIIQRQLPDRLTVDFKERKPIVKVRGINRYFLVDTEGVLLSDMPEQDNLPLIVGLEERLTRVFLGKPCNLDELKNAISLIDMTNKFSLFKNEYRINKVDLSDGLSNMTFFIQQGPQVKIGEGDYYSRLKMLITLLPHLKERLDTIKYIDLRFKEPTVFSKKNGK